MAIAESPPVDLLQTLQDYQDFHQDQNGDWFYSDSFLDVGGEEAGELLEARSRISVNGKRFELGVHIDDVEGLVKLASVINPEAKEATDVASFWNGKSKYNGFFEDDRLYIGRNITPTIIGFEKEAETVASAWNVALIAASDGTNYEQTMKKVTRDLSQEIRKGSGKRSRITINNEDDDVKFMPRFFYDLDNNDFGYCLSKKNKLRAFRFASKVLGDAGYEGIGVLDGESYYFGNGWNVLTGFDYQRNGRVVIRYTGEVILLDQGIVKTHMRPQKFIDFRYPDMTMVK